MSNIVIKGEVHTSEDDLEEERELLVEGVDTLVIEGQKEDAEYGLLRHWYSTAMLIFQLVFIRNLYTDHQILLDIADAQDADIKFTRESNSDIVDNSHVLIEVLAALLFYLLLFISLFYGLVLGQAVIGSFWLLASALLPILILRAYEMFKSEENRDNLIAQKIVEAAEDDGRVVAVMGQSHAKNVPDHLPDDFTPEIRTPSYSVLSVNSARELVVPVFSAFSVLYVLYSIILFFARIWVTAI